MKRTKTIEEIAAETYSSDSDFGSDPGEEQGESEDEKDLEEAVNLEAVEQCKKEEEKNE